MSALKANELTAKIETAMAELYLAKNSTVLPSTGKEDREMLFKAISLGLLRYLEEKEEDFISELELKRTSETNYYKYYARNVKLNIQP